MDKNLTRIRRDLIEPRLTCPLCDNLLQQATSNTECNHTFCRKCINSMIAEEELEWCPICETDWGNNPLEIMRPDHNLQSLRDTVFPLDKERAKAPKIVPLEQSATRGKEKSPSPLVVVSSPSVSVEKPFEKEEKLLEDCQGGSSSHDTANKSVEITEETGESIGLLSLSSPDTALSPFEDNQSTHKGIENDAKPQEPGLDTQEPLNSFAGRSISSKSNVKGFDAKLERMKVNDSDSQVQKAKSKGKKGKKKVEDKKISTDHDSSDTTEINKLRPCRKKDLVYGGSSISPQEVLDATNTELLRNDSVWFNLMASENQEGAPLPQIPSPYIRIKDGSVTVSFIQKYLKRKLGLESEDEVEIKCMEKSVHPIMEVGDLLQSWMATQPSKERITTTMGSSAKEFVMVLTYGRKILNP